MSSVSPDGRAGAASTSGTLGRLTASPKVRAMLAAVACVLIALIAALAVDSRLDRHWLVRGLTLLLALGCAAVLGVENGRRARRIIAGVGMLMFGFVFPVTSTTWATPPEIDFALAVADDAEAAATKDAMSAVTVDHVKAAAEARGGAIGSPVTEKSPEPRGATEYPLIVRPDKNKGRPWACLTFEHGFTAKIRAC
ncbi:hypothetical protein [Kribbella sp. ALI-6-A]|uniref:hypothetical protein n=1 Tax=Kribbella sp. ALI-6-A TaxID=1933817 RepID=UPI001EDBF498|nr:hypothetical protein [Kribbella sp. ALI-6-A]